MVDAAQAHADDEHHAEPERSRKIARIRMASKRHAKTARAFHDNAVGYRGELQKGVLHAIQINEYAGLCRGDMRRDRRLEAVRIHELSGRGDIAREPERPHVVVHQPAVLDARAGCNRFHADGTHAQRRTGSQQTTCDERLADAGIGAGDEKAATRATRLQRHRRSSFRRTPESRVVSGNSAARMFTISP